MTIHAAHPFPMRQWHWFPLASGRHGARLLLLLLSLTSLLASALQAIATPLSIPFHQDFGADSLDAAWKVDVSGDNQVRATPVGLKIDAYLNTYAHILRSLEVDRVRAACTLKPKGGVSWVCSLFLYWDARNWCQVSVLETEASYYAVELIDGRLHEYRRPFAEKADWYRLAIGLGADCLRFQSSPDGKSWDNWLILARPENWDQPPALLVLGKGFSQDDGATQFTAADLNNDFSERGARTVSLLRDVSVEGLPASEARLTELERKELTQNGPDWLGRTELAGPGDSSFASVSRYFPPLRHPREALGVKDGPEEFVVLPDGSLDFGGTNASFLTFVTPEGLLVVGYGLPDTGVQLWAMGQHFRLTHDAAWLRRVAPTMIKMCDWITAARKSSMAQAAPGMAWQGLIKYRPYCDESKPAYSYHTDTYLALGMKEAAAALRGIGMTAAAERIAQEAAAYQRDILESMDRAVLERGGMKMLPMFPETHALLERVGYTGSDYYSLVSGMVLETGMLPANDHRARLITDLLERQNGLCLGVCAFQGGIDHAYSYGYWMGCLGRDEVKRVILGLYTSLAYGMSRDTYSSVEVTFLRTGDNYPTLPHLYSGTQELLLLRNMLLREVGDQLWLGQAIPRPWLENGKEIRVEDAPTLFGKTSYVMRSSNEARRITVDLDPPADPPPRAIQLRLRHPSNRAITRVTVNSAAWNGFAGETVTLTGLKGHAVIEAYYDPL